MPAVYPTISIASLASRTRKDSINQDSVSYTALETATATGTAPLFLTFVSDGMGGLALPHVASREAIQAAMRQFFESDREIPERLAQMQVGANTCLLKHSSGLDLGATLTIALWSNNTVYISHVGDCRAYHIAGFNGRCLTADHSKLAKVLGIQNPPKASVKANPKARSLTRSLGEKEFDSTYPLATKVEVSTGEMMLLCSDGFWTEFDLEEVLEILKQNDKISAQELAEAALERDPSDDVSVLLVRF